MIDKLENILKRYQEIEKEMMDPNVVNDQQRFRGLSIEEANLSPVVEKYKEYKNVIQEMKDSEELLEEETDEELLELAKEELETCKSRMEELEEELKMELLPKDPNDQKNVIVEIRAGAGGDEAALFASELYRMYGRYAERNNGK